MDDFRGAADAERRERDFSDERRAKMGFGKPERT